MTKTRKRIILILHGNRQSGQLLLGRMDRIRKRIIKELKEEEEITDFVAPDAPHPHPEDSNLRTWWNRVGNHYVGLEQSLEVVHEYNNEEIVGIIGFSQGARFAHLLALLHSSDKKAWFPSLSFVIPVAGYDAPLPEELPILSNNTTNETKISLPSMHVWGLADTLITPNQSMELSKQYQSPTIFTHEGSHYVPSKAPQIQRYIDFIRQSMETSSISPEEEEEEDKERIRIPDQETREMQEEEIEALEAIFCDEIIVLSNSFPIHFHMKLLPTDAEEEGTNWPRRPLILDVTFPFDYPLESIPKFQLIHENNIYEFPSNRVEIVMKTLNDTAQAELGMPCILSCLYAVKDYLDSPATDAIDTLEEPKMESEEKGNNDDVHEAISLEMGPGSSSLEEVKAAVMEGLEIAESLLTKAEPGDQTEAIRSSMEKGGAFWTYTIGLVGKPSGT